jgi:ATP-dependent RNA helicase RhlE
MFAYQEKNMTNGVFADLGLHDSFCQTVTELGFTEPSDIQKSAIPDVLAGKDLLGIAQTGTGKTAAFGLPLLQNLINDAAVDTSKMRATPRHPRALILAPTRELAIQIHEELGKLAGVSKMNFACVIGGVNQNPQVKKLRMGVDVLVAAPGRLLDLMNQGHVNLSETKFLVLDECDRLLDMGFIPDVRRIVGAMPKQRQTLLFSATMPTEIGRLAKEILHEPIKVDVSPKEVTVAKIDQRAVMVSTPNKRIVLEHLLRDKDLVRAIVFTRTKHGANKVAKQLNGAGFVAEVIHGNKTQAARQRALENFKKGNSWILVATDIAARGIDVSDVSHVFNYELPHEPESYVHRIGRTARAGAKGIAWALVDAGEISRLRAVERLTKRKVDIVKLDIELPSKPAQSDDDDERGERRQSQQRSRRPAQGQGQGQGQGNSQGQGNAQRNRRRPSGKPSQGEQSSGNRDGNRSGGEGQSQRSSSSINSRSSSTSNGNTINSSNENVNPYGRVGPRAGSSSDGGSGGGGTPRRRRNPQSR